MSREIAGLANRVAGDSENEATEITPDTDTDSQEQLSKVHQQGGSFKRPAPVMGGRGLETRNSKRSQHHPTIGLQHQHKKDHTIVQGTTIASGVPPPPITVGALEVQNVKRAINRYGTLPKGARIGAYLESLRQTSGDVIGGNNPAPVQNQSAIVPPDPPPLLMAPNVSGSALSSRAVVKTQPQMIRSNSSGGVTMTNSATASLNKLQRHRTTTDGTMITFSSFRATSGSPKRAYNPTLADLEFPPPPLDLPPPSEESEIAQELGIPPPPRPQLDSLQMSTISMAPSNDVSNTEPSVEEASSRFGVSLRRREPSTDSCSSLGSPATGDPSQTSDSVKEKLEMKLVSEIKERAEYHQIHRQQPAFDVPNELQTVGAAVVSLNCKAPVDPVLQLVSELAESMNLPKTKPTKAMETSTSAATVTSVPTFKAQLKKVEPKTKSLTNQPLNETNSIIDFKSRLRKVENNNEQGNNVDPSITPTSVAESLLSQQHQQPVPPPPPPPCDSAFGAKPGAKSNIIAKKNGEIKQHDHDNVNNMMLTNRNSSSSSSTNKKPMKSANELVKISSGVELKKTEIKIDIQDEKKRDADNSSGCHGLKSDATANTDDDKRKSTGSISSLKKLWEAKEGSNVDQMSMQLSPKLGIKNATINNNKNADGVDENEDNQLTNRKPAVPIKPTKLVSIYATPIQVKLPSLLLPTPSICDPNNSTTNTTTTNAIHLVTTPAPTTIATSNATTTQINRDIILELVASLESSLKIPVNTISASQWLQLSDKLNILQNSCVVFADNELMPPHSKFHFREVVTRVETQARHFRSAGSKNVVDNEKLVLEVGQSLKQISNALHR